MIEEIDYEEAMRWLVMQRSDGLSEITGRLGGAVHHILGRGKPRGFKGLPDVLRAWWPHPPMNCIVLTSGEHEATIKYPRVMRVLLVNFMLLKYADEIWEGKSYREWLNEPPFVEWL